jgi:hypothetical protein
MSACTDPRLPVDRLDVAARNRWPSDGSAPCGRGIVRVIPRCAEWHDVHVTAWGSCLVNASSVRGWTKVWVRTFESDPP